MALSSGLGDLPNAELRAAMHRVADLVADYLANVGEMPVLPALAPGEFKRMLPAAPPSEGESLDVILDDYSRLIVPNTAHWNHPGFLAYFAITGSAPGIVAEALAASLNLNAMLWRTGPAATELEETVCGWLRDLMQLPPSFAGHITDTASTSTLVALAAARHSLSGLAIRERGLAGRPDVPPLVVYASDQAHSSVDKAAIVLGLGHENVRRVASDANFRLSVPALASAIAADRAAGRRPLAVVATVGTTSTTSIDPVPAIADLCREQGIWLHVDAAYAGSAAICPELRALMPGIERADSLVTNPHKWLFTPVDCSLLYVRDPALLRAAFSLIPEYLRTDEQNVTNLMDTGFQLGRRFRGRRSGTVVSRLFPRSRSGAAAGRRWRARPLQRAAPGGGQCRRPFLPLPHRSQWSHHVAGGDQQPRDRRRATRGPATRAGRLRAPPRRGRRRCGLRASVRAGSRSVFRPRSPRSAVPTRHRD
jgi:aromatic-L-amino-acid decarboxylase